MDQTSADYEELLDRIDERAPLGGYVSQAELPRLKRADLAIYLRANPDCLCDFLADRTNEGIALPLADCIADDSVGEWLEGAFYAYLTKTARADIFERLQDRDQLDDEGADVDRAYLDYIGGQP